MVFRDLLQFLFAFLTQFTTSLAMTGRCNWYNLHDIVAQIYPESDVELLERKGLFATTTLTRSRLSKNLLYLYERHSSTLSKALSSATDYAHAKHVFANYQCESLKDHMQLYLLSDICLLADVFQMFLYNSLLEYHLDPAYFVSAPQLAWNAILKHINRPIPLITDPKMYRMIQPNIYGGICHASVRYARANNKLMCSLYDPTQPTSNIMDVDANTLYGWAMSQEMPDGDFEWVSQNECREMELLLNYADGRIAIFDLGVFNHRVTDEKKNDRESSAAHRHQTAERHGEGEETGREAALCGLPGVRWPCGAAGGARGGRGH